MFEPFKAAPTGAKVANALILLYLFLSWVSTMVTFGSVLHRLTEYTYNADGTVKSFAHLDFYWDHFSVWDDQGIFAFLAFLIHIPLTFSRLAGFSFPLARDTQHSLYIELVLSSIELFCFFLQTTIWGGTCFSPSNKTGSTTGVGYGLIIACFFFLLINELLYLLMRSNDNLVLGNGATRGGGGGGGAYGSEGGGGEYDHHGGDSASQPTFSYQGSGETGGSSL